MTQELTTQPTLSPEVFGRFINLKVAVNLAGSASYDLSELEKVLAGEQLQKGSELVVTARYFVADMTMPVSRETSYSSNYDAKYKLGNAKLALKLIKIESIDVKEARLHQCQAMKCECLVENVPNTEKPDGYSVAEHPLQQFWAKRDCPECHGQGFIFQRESKAPLSRRGYANGVVILVDELPEPPDIPEGGCPQCGERGYHLHSCPVKAEMEAAQKAAIKAAKQAYKAEGGEDAPHCIGTYLSYKSNCKACAALVVCAKACGAEVPAEGEPTAKPSCYGDWSNCEAEDECDFEPACEQEQCDPGGTEASEDEE